MTLLAWLLLATASIVLLVLTVLAVLPDAGAHAHLGWVFPVAVVALVVTAGLGAVALFAKGRAPFRAAIAMALVDVAMLVWVR